LALGACGGNTPEKASVAQPESTPAPVPPAPPRLPDSKSLLGNLSEITGELHSRRIPYDENPPALADCSGMFLRVSMEMHDRCPGIVAPDDITTTRSSAAIANWYRQKGLYSPVSDALAEDRLIQPGTVLFYKDLREDDDISHMGVVTDVLRNDRGEVTRYWLFHGRSGSKPAAITGYHYRNPRNDMPLGVGQKSLVGAAPLCPSGDCGCPDPRQQSSGNGHAPSSGLVRVSSQTRIGEASYYAKSLHGNPTASGETYDHNALTAAHRKLKFGTKVRVTRLDNGKSVVVRINDRGPFAKGRVIDVSGAAAKQLGLYGPGHARVKLEILK
jgi:rare lipoprotein A